MMSSINHMTIEVAFFMSIFSDAAGAGEEKGKGNTPKEEMTCQSSLGHTVNSRVTVIRMDGALSGINVKFAGASSCVGIYF